MTKRFAICLCCVFALLITSTEAWAKIKVLPAVEQPQQGQRLALVVGNGEYSSVPDLDNTINDARAVGATLRQLGYTVHLAENVSRREMNEAISGFLAVITPGAEVFFYYAGHGVELNGANLLLPTDIPALQPGEDRLLRTEGVNLSNLLLDLDARSARMTLAILDACRDNPFAQQGTRSLGRTRGLGRVEPPTGSFVIYAAGAGETALDSLGPNDPNPNGVFTRKLLQLMDEQGLELRSMVRQLRQDVREAALQAGGHSQVPSYYDQLLGDFYFVPQSMPTREAHACEILSDTDAIAEEVLTRDLVPVIAACERAIEELPRERDTFESLLEVVREQEAFQKAMASGAAVFSQAYLKQFPDGRFASRVRQHLAALDPVGPAPAPDPAPTEVVEPDPAPDVDPRELALAVQKELRRVGCNPGKPDGVWGPRSASALDAFSRHASLDVGGEPSPDLLEAIKSRSARVCPAQKKNVARREPAPSPAPAPTQTRNASCFTFNGEQFCD